MNFNNTINRLLLIVSILVVSLLIIVPVKASGDLKGGLSGNIDIDIHVEPYAEIDGADISGTDWMPGTIDNANTNSQGSFSGKPGETRWSQTQVVVNTNTPVNITFDPNSFPNSDLENKWYKFYVQSLENSNSTGDEFLGSDNWNQSFTFTSNRASTRNVFYIKAQATMPEEFWKIKADTYTGYINITVSAL